MLSLDALLMRFNSLPDNKKMELVKTALNESNISFVEELGEVGMESLFPDFEERHSALPMNLDPADFQTQKAKETESLQSYVGETNTVTVTETDNHVGTPFGYSLSEDFASILKQEKEFSSDPFPQEEPARFTVSETLNNSYSPTINSAMLFAA